MFYFTIFLLIGTIFSSSAQCPNGWRPSDVIPNKCYLIVTNKKTNWFDAENYCKSATANGHLTSISSAFEQANVNAIVSETQASSVCDNMWIGADDIAQNGVFTWTDCTPFSFTHWKPGQPILSSDKLCVAADSRSSGVWNTNDCGDEFCFICENDYPHPCTTTSPPTTPYAATTTSYVQPSTTQGPNPATRCQVLDILFLLDESESITEPHFRQITDFASKIASLYTFCGAGNPDGSDCTKFSAIKFGDYAEPIITFNEATSYEVFSSTVDGTSYNLGKTNTNEYVDRKILIEPMWNVDKNALLLAETFFTNSSYGSRQSVPRVIILITDGHHSEGTVDPTIQASKLRIQDGVTIISIGVNGTNGVFEPIDEKELDDISGDPNLVFPSIPVDSLDDAFALEVVQKVYALFPCPAIPCKGVAFLVETSEVVSMNEIVKSLQDVLVISDAVHAADNLIQFALVTFSSIDKTFVHRIFGQDRTYSDWQSFLMDFAKGIQDNTSPYYPFFQGHSEISTGIYTTYQMIAAAKQRNHNFQGSTVIFAQTYLNEFSDPTLDINVVSRMLQSVSPKLYGVNKLPNSNLTIWSTILGSSNAYPLYEDYDNNSNVVTLLEPAVVNYMRALTCQPPGLYYTAILKNSMLYLTIFLLIGTIFSFSAPCPDGWRPSDVIPNKCYLVVTNKKTNWFDADKYCQSATTNGRLTSISSAFEQENLNAIISEAQASSVCDNMWIGADDIAQNGVFTWTDCTPFSFTHWKPGQPVLNSNKLCVAAEARASGYWNTNDCGDEFCFICENNSNCSSTQTTTTIAPPTLPPAAQCYAMDIIFVVDMSQSPNGDTVKRRYKELVQQLGNEISARTVLLDDPQLIDDFQNEKNMLKNITDTFPNGHYGPPVGVQFAEVSFYDRNTAITFYLNSANSQSGYDALIDSMLPYTGDTFIEVGLTAVRDYMLNAIRGYRSNVPTIVMLFSDGNDNPASHPIPIAEQLIQHGVSIFALYNDALDSSPNIALLQQITQDNSRVVPLDQYYTLRQPFYDIINNFIKTTGFDPCHPPVYADIVFVMDHSENQVRAGEVGFATPVDYVMYQKAQIKSIIHQLGVSTRGHRYVLVHFSDSNSYQVPGATHYTNKTGILFDTTVSFTETTMDSYIDNFPELDAGGATDLKLALDVISSAVVPQIASQNDPNRLTYMVIFTSGFYDTETNCCQDPLQSALAVQSQFKANTIIPVMSGKLADRNPTAFLEYTGYSNQLPQYDVNQTLTADSIVQTIKKAISAQEAANSAGKKI